MSILEIFIGEPMTEEEILEECIKAVAEAIDEFIENFQEPEE